MRPENARKALLRYMEWESEERWCAGWLTDLEHILWDEVITGKDDVLRELAEDARGWWTWDDAAEDGRRFVPASEWEGIHGVWRSGRVTSAR